jgi:hypothetical protein
MTEDGLPTAEEKAFNEKRKHFHAMVGQLRGDNQDERARQSG